MMPKITLAAAALVALGGAALISAAPASAAPAAAKADGYLIQARYDGPAAQRHRRPARVHASGVARGGVLVPYFVKKAKAQREAVENWSAKVARTYGQQYANWSRAQGKTTACSRTVGAVSCRVSAVPNGYGRFGLLH